MAAHRRIRALVIMAGLTGTLLAGCASADRPDANPAAAPPTAEATTVTSAVTVVAEERLRFNGDRTAAAEAGAKALRVRQALAPLAQRGRPPTVAEVERALTQLAPSGDVQVSDDAVATTGTAFGVATPGGCLYGSVSRDELTVDVGGTVQGGGCLAGKPR